MPWTSCSTVGCTSNLASGVASQLVKLQPCVTASLTKAEYPPLLHRSKKAIHLSQLLSELAQGSGNGNSQGANTLSQNLQFHNCTQHLCLTEHSVLEEMQQVDIALIYILPACMISYGVTKPFLLRVFAIGPSSHERTASPGGRRRQLGSSGPAACYKLHRPPRRVNKLVGFGDRNLRMPRLCLATMSQQGGAAKAVCGPN